MGFLSKGFRVYFVFRSLYIWAQQKEEYFTWMPCFSVYLMASSLGNAMPSMPALRVKISVSARCLPFGLMHPSTSGVLGNIARAVAVVRAMVIGGGGLVFAMVVPWMGMKLMMTIADGLKLDIVFSAFSSPLS